MDQPYQNRSESATPPDQTTKDADEADQVDTPDEAMSSPMRKDHHAVRSEVK